MQVATYLTSTCVQVLVINYHMGDRSSLNVERPNHIKGDSLTHTLQAGDLHQGKQCNDTFVNSEHVDRVAAADKVVHKNICVML